MAAIMTGKHAAAARSNSPPKSAESTGLPGSNMALTVGAGRDWRPLSAKWMTDELIAHTRRVWSAYLGQPVTEAEAVEMLTNVRNVGLAILTAEEDGEIAP